MLKKKSDNELVRGMQGGDQDCFEELILRYSNKAFSLAARLTRCQEDAEEVLQDVFVTVFRKIKGFEGKSSFSSWLYRITVNAALMKLRKKRQTQSTISVEDIQPQLQESVLHKNLDQEDCDELALRRQLTEVLEDAIFKLPEDYRPVFILRDIDGLTSREVGKILDLSVPAVKSRLHRSRLMLRRRLQKFYKEFSSGVSPASRKLAGNF